MAASDPGAGPGSRHRHGRFRPHSELGLQVCDGRTQPLHLVLVPGAGEGVSIPLVGKVGAGVGGLRPAGGPGHRRTGAIAGSCCIADISPGWRLWTYCHRASPATRAASSLVGEPRRRVPAIVGRSPTRGDEAGGSTTRAARCGRARHATRPGATGGGGRRDAGGPGRLRGRGGGTRRPAAQPGGRPPRSRPGDRRSPVLDLADIVVGTAWAPPPFRPGGLDRQPAASPVVAVVVRPPGCPAQLQLGNRLGVLAERWRGTARERCSTSSAW